MIDLLAETAPPEPRPEPKRDRFGRYLLPHPETGKEQSWTRATTFASSISDTFSLTKWQLRMALVGVAARPDLLALAASIHDPDDRDAKKTLDRIAEDAKQAAGASTRAGLGTALHSFCEHADLGRDVAIPAPWDADVAAYRTAMDAAGITIDRSHVEQIVVVPELGVAGTFDRLCTLPDGRLVVADLKTGRDLSYSWTEIAVQLALYAHASHIYDTASGTLTPMPQVDLEQALVMWLPAGEARCQLFAVDIVAGWETASLCGAVRDWRKRKDLARPLSLPVGDALNREEGTQASATPGPTSPTGSPLDDYQAEPARPDRRDWIRRRVADLFDAELGSELAAIWPDGVPGFKVGHEHTNPEVVAIAKACGLIEAKHRRPFLKHEDPAELERYDREERGVRPDDDQVLALADALRVLPPDILADLEAEIIDKRGWPSLTSGRCSRAQLDEIAVLAADAASRHAARCGMTRAHLAMLERWVPAGLHHLFIAAVTRDRHDEPDRLTGWQVDRLGELVDAVGAGLLAVVDGDLVVNEAAVYCGVNTSGPASSRARNRHARRWTKGDLRDLGRRLAGEHGLDKPRSAADVIADPVLTALVAAQ